MSIESLRRNKTSQMGIALAAGILFGFLLQKGGVTQYDVIIRQLLLEDFTVVRIMVSAMITGMIGVHALRSLGLATLHPKPGSLGATVIGGLLFGVGFGLLGYCPGTVVGAAAQGSMDALLGGVVGILIGAGLFAALYPGVDRCFLHRGDFGEATLPQMLKVNPWALVVPISVLMIGLLWAIRNVGL